ncbi:hypothetical protein NV379_23065 [Paenibacillus sp. N1-5-1-14]|uniref:hypothetical protein n=1 Tax=Paenibacillus radicibacter TaxID=2972488 RepID=UPI0021598832|nr:hypothetical protein [Paenibacillus radicibacter]MCR8645522.1 hypothetical protein [Paenibacillus radicibacter]
MRNNFEQLNEPLLTLVYTLITGYKGQVNLPKSKIMEFIEHFKQGKNYVTTSYDETYGLNPSHVVDFRVVGLYQKEVGLLYMTEEEKAKQRPKLVQTEETEGDDKLLAAAYNNKSAFYKIDCKCGAIYTVQLSAFTNTGKCNKCKEVLFVDRARGKIDTYKGQGWIMTNKYPVDPQAK